MENDNYLGLGFIGLWNMFSLIITFDVFNIHEIYIYFMMFNDLSKITWMEKSGFRPWSFELISSFLPL
jgi:hypothetical protein